MKVRELARRPTLKTFVILAGVTLLYTIYRYQGSPEFYLASLNGFLASDAAPGSLQAASVHYQRATALLLLGVIPALIVRIGFGEKLADYGLGVTRPLHAALVSVLGAFIAATLTYPGARDPELAAIYPQVENAGVSPLLFAASSLSYLLYYAGYEFCFRGFLFLGTREDLGDWQALGVSLLASVLLHVTQPRSEMLMSIVAGIVFALLAKRFRSIWPGFVIHASTGISLDYWIVLSRGGF